MSNAAPLMTAHPLTGARRRITPDLLRDVYLAPRPEPFVLDDHITGDAAPWARSFAVAPSETTRAIETALRQLMQATCRLDPSEVQPQLLKPASRLRRHVEALERLWRDLGAAIPEDLQVLRHVVNVPPGATLEDVPLLDAPEGARETALERTLRETLEQHHGRASERDQQRWREHRRELEQGAAQNGSLGHLQHNLLDGAVQARPLDGSVTFHGLRDHAEEAAFAAALAQRLLDDGQGDAPSDIAVLVPSEAAYLHHVETAFAAVGLPLGGGTPATHRRDLAGECVLHFLLACRPPAPAMALASLYVSPLMPWAPETGRAMAREVMNGRFVPRIATELTGSAERLFAELRRETRTGAQLKQSLATLAQCLGHAPALREDIQGVRQRIAALAPVLDAAGEGEPDWETLLQIAAPQGPSVTQRERHVEGVTVITEDMPAWRPAQQLIVLGCAGGRYPRRPSSNPFFLDSERDELRHKAGLRLPGQKEILGDRLELFRRQLCSARRGVHFLRPWRGADGVALAGCTGLSLVARTIEGGDTPDGLFRDPRETPVTIQHPVLAPGAGEDPVMPVAGEIRLGRNLLKLRRDGEGRARPQSPSRLETLLVSPLAWVLAELGAEDVPWQPEEWDVLSAGSVAHDVIENLFPADTPLPTAEQIEERVPGLVAQALQRHAPFLNTSVWAVERISVQRELRDAALRWRTALDENALAVLDNEMTLSGHAHGVMLTGRVDCLLGFPDGRILIVDHKRSGSRKRRERMQAGWDLQLALYRAMLAHPAGEPTPLGAQLGHAPELGVAYHMMSDGGILTHGLTSAPAPFEPIGGDIAQAAMDQLCDRLADIRAGRVTLNNAEDEKFFTREAKLTPYALDASPLIRAFMVGDAELAGDDADA